MGRKLWPWAQSERIWLSGASCEPPLNYKDWALTRLFKGASYTTTVSAFPSWAIVFHSAYYDQDWSGFYTGSIYPLGWGSDSRHSMEEGWGGVDCCQSSLLSTQTWPCHSCPESWGFLRMKSRPSLVWQCPQQIGSQPLPPYMPCVLWPGQHNTVGRQGLGDTCVTGLPLSLSCFFFLYLCSQLI